MTYKEKLRQEHPDKIDDACDGGCRGCPHSYGYEPCRDSTGWCLEYTCTECWNREISSIKSTAQTFGNHAVEIPYTGRTPVEYVDVLESTSVEPHILDSGELTTFETGAVRSHFNADGTSKGRCDLLPLRVIARIWRAFDTSLQDYGVDKARVFDHIADFQDTGNAQHLVFALNSFTGYLDFPTAFLEVAIHYEEGAEKYGECNWQKGLPVNNYVDSMVRHYLKWLRGDTDEPHDRAFVWNVLCCIWECEFSPRATSRADQDAPVMVLEHATRARSNRVAYLCDRKACPTCDNTDCHHTDDINHAVNFEAVGEGKSYTERDNSRLLLKNAAPGVYEMFGQLCLKGEDSVVYSMATGCPVITTGLAYCQKLSLDNVYHGVEGLILGTAPGGALFFHEGDVWLRTTANSNTENVYAVRLRDGKSAYVSVNTLVTSVEDFDFK